MSGGEEGGAARRRVWGGGSPAHLLRLGALGVADEHRAEGDAAARAPVRLRAAVVFPLVHREQTADDRVRAAEREAAVDSFVSRRAAVVGDQIAELAGAAAVVVGARVAHRAPRVERAAARLVRLDAQPVPRVRREAVDLPRDEDAAVWPLPEADDAADLGPARGAAHARHHEERAARAAVDLVVAHVQGGGERDRERDEEAQETREAGGAVLVVGGVRPLAEPGVAVVAVPAVVLRGGDVVAGVAGDHVVPHVLCAVVSHGLYFCGTRGAVRDRLPFRDFDLRLEITSLS